MLTVMQSIILLILTVATNIFWILSLTLIAISKEFLYRVSRNRLTSQLLPGEQRQWIWIWHSYLDLYKWIQYYYLSCTKENIKTRKQKEQDGISTGIKTEGWSFLNSQLRSFGSSSSSKYIAKDSSHQTNYISWIMTEKSQINVEINVE